MLPRIAFTIAIGPEAMRQARLLRATFKAVHPDVPFLLVDGPLYARFALQPGVAHGGEIMGMRAVIGRYLSRHAARVAYFDADVLVFSPLPLLLDDGAPVVALTRDVALSTAASAALPPVNAGVLSASDPRFWHAWTRLIESHLLPLIGNFFDQLALRLLAAGNAMPCTLLPEIETGDYHNVAAFDAPGEWRREGDELFKGGSRVRLWHWAGYGSKPGIEAMPTAVQPLVRERLESGKHHEAATQQAEAGLFAALFQETLLAPFLGERAAELNAIPTTLLEGMLPFRFSDQNQAALRPPEGLWGTDVPAVWDTLRQLPSGYHRRLLPRAPRYLYAKSEERLYAPDVERYDRALVSG